LVCACSLLSFGGQVFLSKAFQLEKAARIAFTHYIWIATGAISDIFLFKSTFYWTDIVGCVLIIGIIFSTTLLKAIGVYS